MVSLGQVLHLLVQKSNRSVQLGVILDLKVLIGDVLENLIHDTGDILRKDAIFQIALMAENLL